MNKYVNPLNYYYYLIGKLIVARDLLLSPLNRYFLERYKSLRNRSMGPIFIIGSPRTGSTILYQILTHFWDIGYISNFECSLHKNIVLASFLSKRIFGERPHGCFTAKYGTTRGRAAPSECGTLWYQWFPKESHFVESHEIDDSSLNKMKNVVYSVIAAKRKSLLIKNLNCGQRLRALVKAFPEAQFIFCRRNPLYAAQSLLVARKRVHGSTNKWFSVMPKEYPQLKLLSPVEQVVAQIYYIEKQIINDLNRLFPDSYLMIEYEDFCSRPEQELNRVIGFIERDGFKVQNRTGFEMGLIQFQNEKTIDDKTFDKLRYYVKEYFR